ncbi:hypothetical protein ACLUTX_14430 [Enterobacterales bacterium AE_CKDN230030158-1A_HGKHYDSX7]
MTSLALRFRPAVDADLAFLRALHASTRPAELAQAAWGTSAIDAFLTQQFDVQHHYAPVCRPGFRRGRRKRPLSQVAPVARRRAAGHCAHRGPLRGAPGGLPKPRGGVATHSGGSQPFSLRNSYLSINFIIALKGVFPSRN